MLGKIYDAVIHLIGHLIEILEVLHWDNNRVPFVAGDELGTYESECEIITKENVCLPYPRCFGLDPPYGETDRALVVGWCVVMHSAILAV